MIKKFTSRGLKILRCIRRKDFDIIHDTLSKIKEEDIERYRNLSDKNKELLNFLSYYNGYNFEKDINDLVSNIKNLSVEDINSFQNLYKFSKINRENDNISLTYLLDKYSKEELEFLKSLTDDDLDNFEEENYFVDDDYLYLDEDENWYLKASEAEDFINEYYEYFDENEDCDLSDISHDGITDFYIEVNEEDEDDYEEENINPYFENHSVDSSNRNEKYYDIYNYENEKEIGNKTKLIVLICGMGFSLLGLIVGILIGIILL